jgi:sorbitol-6-phosphate 2-dehydrogenase
MNETAQSLLGPLVRGLYLGRSHTPVCLTTRDGEGSPGALRVTRDGKAQADERELGEILMASWEAWGAGRAADELPPCVEVTLGNTRSSFFPGATLDESRSRALSGRAEPFSVGAAPTQRSHILRGRVALVTGGAQGFGEEIVRGLVAAGALLFVADRNMPLASKLASSLSEQAGATVALPLEMDVTDEASVGAGFASVVEQTGGLDLVVSNAGVLKAGSVLEQELAAFRFVTDVNYLGFFLVSKHAGLVLRRQARTAPSYYTDIVQINSKSGLQGSNKNGAYAGSKFGGLGLVQSFALELVEHRIKVNAICPGNFFDGPLWSDPENGLFVQYLRSGKVPGAKTLADVKTFYESKVPMGRGCRGIDVMRALTYIVEQEYETGQALPVTGGQVMLA